MISIAIDDAAFDARTPRMRAMFSRNASKVGDGGLHQNAPTRKRNDRSFTFRNGIRDRSQLRSANALLSEKEDAPQPQRGQRL